MSSPRPRPIALVTGASRGIGSAVARVLASTHDVLLGGRDVAALERLATELPGSRAWPVDLTDFDAVEEAAAGIERLDVLVHSAGVARLGSVAQTPAAIWLEQFQVNVIAVAELTRVLLPALRRARGRVVLVNSTAGLTAPPGWAAYSASKYALRAFAEALRAEEEGNGVRVTSIFPGHTDTDMQRAMAEHEGREYRPEEYLRPESVAGAVLLAVTAPPDAALTELVLRPDGTAHRDSVTPPR